MAFNGFTTTWTQEHRYREVDKVMLGPAQERSGPFDMGR